MATLTIRNLPEEVHDELRREAAAHRRSMEEEARRALAEKYRPRPSPEKIEEILASIRSKWPPLPPDAKMLVSESLLADRRLEVLSEEGLITPEEWQEWNHRIQNLSVSLDEVQAFFDSKWAQRKS